MKRFFPLIFLAVFSSCKSIDPAQNTGNNMQVSPQAGLNEEPGTLAESIYRTAFDFAELLPAGEIIGVINITSGDAGEGEFAEEQLIFCLVQTGKFRIVERRDLDIIRREQNFHLSGEVDDATAVSIGRMAGAGTVITGSIISYGGGRYINTKAIDVETSEIKAAVSKSFVSVL